jgi:predicted MFS family arabinose efflux permease
MTSTTADPHARAMRMLSLAAFASMASMRWCDALLPVLQHEFGGTPGQTAQVVYAFAIVYGVMQLLYGPLGDRLGKTTVVSWAALACTVGALASAFAPSLAWLTMARVLNGAAAAAIIPLTMAWIGDNVPWDQRQPALARLMGATVIGMVAGQWSSGLFADSGLGWRTGFMVLASLFAVAGGAMRLSMRHQRPAQGPGAAAGPAPSALQRMREVVASAHARQVLGIVAVEGGFAFSAMAFAPSHLHTRFGLAVAWAGAILALYGLGGLAYSLSVRFWVARLSAAAMARTGGVLAGLAWLGFALAPNWWATLPLCALAGLGFYMIHNTLQTQATQMVPSQRGTAVSLFACTLFLGQSLGMLVAAWGVDQLGTGPVVALYGIGLCAVGVVAAKLVRPLGPPPA